MAPLVISALHYIFESTQMSVAFWLEHSTSIGVLYCIYPLGRVAGEYF